MRAFARLSLLFLVLGLSVAPVVAASALSPAGLTWTTSAERPSPEGAATFAWLAGVALVVGITIRADTGTLAAKFVTRAQAASPDYKAGVQAAGGDWENNTKAAEGNYEQGVQQSIADKRFGKGVSGSGAKYQTNATTLGATRYGPGVANAKDAWARGVQPALDTLKGLTLPPKGPRRSPQNMARANAVAVALGAMKTGR